MRLVNIEEEIFFIRAVTLDEAYIKQNLVFGVTSDIEFDVDKHHVLIQLKMNINPRLEPNSPNPFLHFIGKMRYEVYGIEILEGDKLPKIPMDIAQALVAATYSTFRGLIYARCGGSSLRHAILPLADPSTMLADRKTFLGEIKVLENTPENE